MNEWYQAALYLYVFGAWCRENDYVWVKQEGAVLFHYGRRALGGYNAFTGF